MSTVVHVRADLQFKVVTPDEIGRIAYYALLHGLSTENHEEAVLTRAAVRDVLPMLGVQQLAMLLAAPWESATTGRMTDWQAFRADIEALLA